jgi:hypothetical protein
VGSDTYQKCKSIFMTMAGRLTRLAEEELKICVQMKRLNSKK